jgi:hypothetical protein
MEGLLRSPAFPALILIGLLGFALAMPFASMLPRPVQRTLSFLPLDIDPSVRYEAQNSIDWRLEMWRMVIPDLPKYVWLGKGYAVDPTDLYLAEQAELRGRAMGFDATIVAGDHHNGFLSLFIPFGLFGSLAFGAFLISATRALFLNNKYGDPALGIVNRFLFAYFLGKVIIFFTIFGGFYGDFAQMIGPVGLSVALNRGICRRAASLPRPVLFSGNFKLRPA